MPETFVHSQPVREARRRRRHLSAPTAGSCRQTCYCKTLKRCTGSWARAGGRGGGLKAPRHHPPAGEGPGPQLSILRVGGLSWYQGKGCWMALATWFPLVGSGLEPLSISLQIPALTLPGMVEPGFWGLGVFFGPACPKRLLFGSGYWCRVRVHRPWGCCHPVPRCQP